MYRLTIQNYREFRALNRKGLIEKLEAKVRKILRKILESIKENGLYRRLQRNNELHVHVEMITDTIRNGRINFYRHLTRITSKIMTNRTFSYFLNKKTKGSWYIKVEGDLQEVGIAHEDIKERIPS